jgi:hypothetical protein
MPGIFAEYLAWHFIIAPNELVAILRNYMAGTWHQFMIPRHLKTLFAPWHRLLPSDLSEKQTFGTKILNKVLDIYIRLVAAVIRLTLIAFGLALEVLWMVVFLVTLLAWVLWPILATASLVYGFTLL